MSGWGWALVALLVIAAWAVVRVVIKRREVERIATMARAPRSDRPVATPPALGLVSRDRPAFEPINHRDREMGFEPPLRAPLELTEVAAEPAPRPPKVGKVKAKVEVEVRYRRMAKLPKAPQTAEPVADWKDHPPSGKDPLFSISRTLVDGKPTSGWQVQRIDPPKPMGRRPTKATATAAPPKGGKTASGARARRTKATTAKRRRK